MFAGITTEPLCGQQDVLALSQVLRGRGSGLLSTKTRVGKERWPPRGALLAMDGLAGP